MAGAAQLARQCCVQQHHGRLFDAGVAALGEEFKDLLLSGRSASECLDGKRGAAKPEQIADRFAAVKLKRVQAELLDGT